MQSYDEADKSNWIEMSLELSDDLIENLKQISIEQNRELSDLISKFLYEWWQKEIQNDKAYDNLESNQES
jgi:hypothetical protein